MKRIFLGSLSAAALTLGAHGAIAQAESGSASGSAAGDMSMITCAQFLALSEMDRETHATALTAARPDSIGEEGADRGEVTGGMPPLPEQDAAADSGGGTEMSGSGSATSEDGSMAGGSASGGTDMSGSGAGGGTDMSGGSASGGTDMSGGSAGGGTDMAGGSASGGGDMSGGTDMAAGGSGSDGSGSMASGGSAGTQSPTAVALVTICENTEGMAGGGASGGSGSGSGSGTTAN